VEEKSYAGRGGEIGIMETLKKNKFVALVFVVCLLVASSSLSISVYAATHPSFTTTVETGSMVDTVSYVIFKDGSTYFAKNGTTGAIDYSGTNGTQVTQNAVDNTDCGTILFKATDSIYEPYVLKNILINGSKSNRITIKGESFKGVYIEADVGASYVFNVTGGVWFVSFVNLDINGKEIASNLLFFDDCDRINIEHILCYGATSANIDIQSPCAGVYISHVYSHCPCQIALNLQSGASHIWIDNSEFGNGTYASIVGTGANEVFINNVKALNTINFEFNDKWIMLNNIKVSAAMFDGLRLFRCTHVMVSNLIITNIGCNATGSFDGISLSSYGDNHDFQFSNIEILYDGYGTMRYGLNVEAENVTASNVRVSGASTAGVSVSGDYNILYGLDTRGCSTGILDSGSNNHINLSWNATNWIS